MKEFLIEPKICLFEKCKDFIEVFHPNEKDLIITTEFLYKSYFEKFNLSSNIIYQDKYGTGEPTDEMIEKIYKDIEALNFQRIIAIGGGTIIDIAKIFVLKNILPLSDLFEKKILSVKDKKLIIIPTTCGTGSEVNNISIVNLLSKNTKMGLATSELFAEHAVLITELVLNLPHYVFSTSTIDALVHAVESALSPKATDYSKLFSYEAIRKILISLKKIKEEGLENRAKYLHDILIASNMAGIAFSNAGCGAVHAMSYPLGSKFHVAHGESNYALFTGVLKYYNLKNPNGHILSLNQKITEILDCSLENVYDSLENLLNYFLQKKKLSEYGMTEKDIEDFSNIVIEKQQRLMANNYIFLEKDDVYKIYKTLY